MQRRLFLSRLGLVSIVPMLPGLPSVAKANSEVIEQSRKLDVIKNFVGSLRELESGKRDCTEAFDQLEVHTRGQKIDLHGVSCTVKRIPAENIYVNGRFITGQGAFEAAENSVMIGSPVDTGGIEPAFQGGAKKTPTLSGRSTAFSRVVIACKNCRAMFARSVVIGSVYTWVKSNLGFAAASRQCVVNGPQASTISAEECQSYGFRALNYGSIFSTATVSTGGNIATRHAQTSGSYVLNLASNTSRIGRGYGAQLQVSVSSGVVVAVKVIKSGRGYRPSECKLEVEDRLGRGRGCKAIMECGPTGKIEAIAVVSGGRGYSGSTEAIIIHNVAESAVMGSSNSLIFDASNSLILSSRRCQVSSSLVTVMSSQRCQATGGRSTIIGSSDSKAIGSGCILIGAYRSVAAASGAVVMGRRTISKTPNSFSFGNSDVGRESVENLKFQVGPGGKVTAAGYFAGEANNRGYAEFFRNAVHEEISLGSIVKISSGVISLCEAGEEVLGVVSNSSLLVAGDSTFHWSSKFLLGDFGEIVYEEVKMVRWFDERSGFSFDGPLSEAGEVGKKIPSNAEFYTAKVPKVNPNYDGLKEYVPRSERKDQWSCVSLIGTVKVRIGRGVKSGDYLVGTKGLGVKADKGGRLLCLEVCREYGEDKGYGVASCLLR